MSLQYNDPNGRAPASHGAPQGSPSMKSHPGGVTDPRYRPRPPPQENPPPLAAMEPAATYYSGRDSPGPGPEQWPLPALPLGQGSPRPNSPAGSSPKKPPPRPPREGYHDPMLAQYRQQARMAPAPGYGYPRGPPPAPRQHHGPAQWAGDGYMHSNRPFPPSSGARRPPPPAMYHQQRQQHPPRGMPPSARKGPAGYYDQRGPPYTGGMGDDSGVVTPPVSDNALSPFTPPHAGKNVPSYYFEQRGNSPSPAPGAAPVSSHAHHDSPMETHQTSIAKEIAPEQRDEASPEPTTIIRQASLGKKTRPTLTTIKGGERKRGSSSESASTQPSLTQVQSTSREQLTPFEEEMEQPPGAWISEGPTPAAESTQSKAIASLEAVVGAEEVSTVRKGSNDRAAQRRSSDILGGSPPVRSVSPIDSSNDTTEEHSDFGAAIVSPVMATAQLEQPRSPLSPESQDKTPSHHPLTPNSTTELKPSDPRWSEESEKRKLKDLTIDIAKVREAEARGSITSLPDLIKRATRLASNLDRGKTASRMGLNFFDFNTSSDAVEKLRAAENKNRRSGGSGISGMLFPPPSAKEDVRGSKGNFSSMLRRSQIPSESDTGEFQEKKERKYCGLSLRLLVLLLVLLFLLIAAAVIIPVVLVVLPKQGNDNNTTPPPSNPALAKCENQLTCQNGGLNIIGTGESCSCLCINGYTGSTCSTLSKTGCTTMSAGSTKNATVGENIPRLIAGANSNFTIPLDGETLLGLFSKADLSCTSENALVTFSDTDSQANSAVIVRDAQVARGTSLVDRQTDTPASSAGSSSSLVDFAKVAVLYIFQQTTKLESAASAQDTFQSYFKSRSTFGSTQYNPRNVTLGSGFSCDLVERSLVWTLANGTTVAS